MEFMKDEYLTGYFSGYLNFMLINFFKMTNLTGGAAYLPGVTAALTSLPVLGIPMLSKLSGLDSLLSIAQMPAGIPVATFSIGSSGSKNTALYAVRILALQNKKVANKLGQYIKKMEVNVPKNPKNLK